MLSIRSLPRARRVLPLMLASLGWSVMVQAEEAALSAGEIEFPSIPQIVVPDIVGVGPAQAALEDRMKKVIDPVAGISIRAARCDTEGSLINQAGITSFDEQGNLTQVSEKGIFAIEADGSGTANFEGGIISIEADGSGTINGSGKAGYDKAIISVETDGSGTYNGRYGIISLDGDGAGTWNGSSGIINNKGDGSGTWNGPLGIISIEADGSGSWLGGPLGRVINHGDGTGLIGPPPGRKVKMAPIPKVAPAGRFPLLNRFSPPGAPCGYVITLGDQVLFDFDKSDIRADAAKVLDNLADALGSVEVKNMEIRGHTDSKGSDEYNQGLSERRANAVLAALRERGAAQKATARGYGESQPVAPNQLKGQDYPAGRQLNRRVEIFVRT